MGVERSVVMLAACVYAGCAHGPLSAAERAEYFTCEKTIEQVASSAASRDWTVQRKASDELIFSPKAFLLKPGERVLVPTQSGRKLGYAKGQIHAAARIVPNGQGVRFVLYLDGVKLSEPTETQSAHRPTQAHLEHIKKAICGGS